MLISSSNSSDILKDVDNQLVQAQERASKESITVEKAIKKDFLERMLGQFTVFIIVVSLILLTVLMVYLKVPDFYCIIVVLLSQIVLFTPKIAVYYMNQKATK